MSTRRTNRRGKDTTAGSADTPPSDISSESPGNNNNNNDDEDVENGTGITPKEKANFNARLEERRRQRRGQRQQRKELHRIAMGLDGRCEGGVRGTLFRSKLFLLLVLSFGCILSFWMFAFLYLAQQDMEFVGSAGGAAVKSPFQLLDRKAILETLQSGVTNAIHKIPKGLRNKMKKLSGNNNILNAADDGGMVGDPSVVIDMRKMSHELPFDNPNGGKWTQGWDVQPVELTESKPLRVFVIPHSHCDPGWIKTFDDYFQSQTKQILTSAIEALLKDPKRKFIWAEISYFEWWWKEQTEERQKEVRVLLDNKQFEFVTGGWVQPDEANTQLYAMEIQLQEGHDFIRETFGDEYIPKYGWSIDPFGYSPTMAYLLKKYNFKAMLIQRVHYAIKKELALHKNLEFMWRQTWDKTGEFDIFTHAMPFYSYDVPHTCGPDPSICCQFDFARVPGVTSYVGRCDWKIDAEFITDANLEERSLTLLDQYRKKANLYRTNVVLVPLGDDFRYRTAGEAEAQFSNYQSMFDYINENVKNVEISFGTLSDYFKTVMDDRPFSPPILKGSFFTYSDREQDYWSGYYTSRIFDKALDRKLEQVLYAASSLGANKKELQGPRRALSLFQHHDGVTGTAKDVVVEDYARRIHGAISDTQNWILKRIVSKETLDIALQLKLQACWQSTAPRGLSQNLCESASKNAKIIVYNPLPTEQSCGSVVVPGRTLAHATLPCETPGPLLPGRGDDQQPSGIKFDPTTGLMIHPVREEWMVWKVREGGAYLFFPGTLEAYNEIDLDIRDGGSVVITPHWKRTVVERKLPKTENGDYGGVAIDFVYETNLQTDNEEWFARFTSPDIQNQGLFHTDLNGYNFDTHHYRSDMPIQSQVFPMPTLASIEDSKKRMTVLSEHAQGTASLEEGVIDVWLDRRLSRDDNRGLFQGVRDNVPTRTRLRVVLENRSPEDSKEEEFATTEFCMRQWKELNHPLEMFGSETVPGFLSFGTPDVSAIQLDNSPKKFEQGSWPVNDPNAPKQIARHDDWGRHKIAAVFMVYNRIDYLKQAIGSLRESDYPKSMPVIISHDGHIPEMVDYVESLKSEFKIVQLFHPYACFEHPNTFPGDDPKLNENYKGDTYGNKREGKITCCKHHFTWLMNTVFSREETQAVDGFLFMEEDYIVAPTIYESIQKGFTYIDNKNLRKEFFGLTFDPSLGYSYPVPEADWIEALFVSGPMAIRRDVFADIKAHAKEFCTFDDYNWDWSIVHLMAMKYVSSKILEPGTLQVAHIGLSGGMHHDGDHVDPVKVSMMNKYVRDGRLEPYHADVGVPHVLRLGDTIEDRKGYGGWGHPADHEHCLQVFADQA